MGTHFSKKLPNTHHRLKDTSGKYVSERGPRLVRWNKPGPWGFAYWLQDIQPCVLTSSNRYERYKPTKKQAEIIKKVLASDDNDKFIHSLSLLIQPRRHGKSTLFALICLWLVTSRKNITIQLLGNSEQHVKRVQFNTLIKIIKHTPKLRLLFPDKNILVMRSDTLPNPM